MSRTKADLMNGVVCDKSKKIANNTVEYWQGKNKVIRLHDTDIIKFNRLGNITLDSGGWQTVTTKERINRLQKVCRIIQEKGIWYVSVTTTPKTIRYHNGDDYTYQVRNKDSLFFDGIKISKDGKILTPRLPENSRKFKKDQKIKKAINKYVKAINDLETLPEPSNGDCLMCRMGFGEAEDHLLLHLKEGYIMHSLILRALQWANYGNPEFVYRIFEKRRGERISIKSAVRRYLKRQLGLVS